MFIIHVERSGAVLPFFSEVSTQSPLPNSCLEYGGFQCSHISIIHCVFYCFIVFIHGLFHFLVPFNLLFHLFSFRFIFSHFLSFLFIFLISFISFHVFLFFLFFSLEKTIPNLNHLHVDPRLSSAELGLALRNLVLCGGIWRRSWAQDRPNVGNMAWHEQR